VTTSPSGTTFNRGTVVTLTATPNTGSTFAGWSGGGCSGTVTTCRVTMNANTSVTATFNTARYTLSANSAGTGFGTVTTSPAGPTYASGTVVTLTAAPTNLRSTFAGWSGGGCSGTSTTCQVTVNANTSVTATFNTSTDMFSLDVTKDSAGTGGGGISISPGGLIYARGTVVTVAATASGGSIFAGWSGGSCSGTATTCQVTMNSNRSVVGRFDLGPNGGFTLATTTGGTGSGTVTRSAPGPVYAGGALVTLTATPNAGSTFAGWNSVCAGMGTTCTVTMNSSVSVTATFNSGSGGSGSSGGPPYTLEIDNFAGNGSGTVTANPSGPTYASGTMVTLTATPRTGSVFGAWYGACSGVAGPVCRVTMVSNAFVAAAFNIPSTRYTLTIRSAGTGAGTVSPGSSTYDTGTRVTLTATASTGSAFAGWSGGGCSGTSTTCQVLITANTTVTANFTQNSSSSSSGGRDASGCVTTRNVSGTGQITNNCGEKVFYLYCGDLKFSSLRCGGRPGGGYYTHSNNLAPGQTNTFTLNPGGIFYVATCYGNIGFGNDGHYQDFPNGSYRCLKE